jgi:hypothetical protein
MATTKKKDPAAVRLGRRGGRARMSGMTAEERSALGRAAIAARWAKRDEDRGKGAAAPDPVHEEKGGRGDDAL